MSRVQTFVQRTTSIKATTSVLKYPGAIGASSRSLSHYAQEIARFSKPEAAYPQLWRTQIEAAKRSAVALEKDVENRQKFPLLSAKRLAEYDPTLFGLGFMLYRLDTRDVKDMQRAGAFAPPLEDKLYLNYYHTRGLVCASTEPPAAARMGLRYASEMPTLYGIYLPPDNPDIKITLMAGRMRVVAAPLIPFSEQGNLLVLGRQTTESMMRDGDNAYAAPVKVIDSLTKKGKETWRELQEKEKMVGKFAANKALIMGVGTDVTLGSEHTCPEYEFNEHASRVEAIESLVNMFAMGHNNMPGNARTWAAMRGCAPRSAAASQRG